MKVVLAPDSFKESLSAAEVCDAMSRGVRTVLPDAEIIKLPLADGGEGTVRTLVAATHGRVITQTVTGPLGRPVEAEFGILGDSVTAVIEMASASGLPLLPVDERNPLFTTTYGTGEIIKAALDYHLENIIIGIGGSATNDGGTGMAQALGAQFYKNGSAITGYMTGDLMGEVTRVDVSALDSRIAQVSIKVMCDVDNPLLGERGAAHVYGPQKGATPEIVEQLERNMSRIYDLIEPKTRLVRDKPGAGAAGGLGAGLMAFLDAVLCPGIEAILNFCHFDDQIRDADLIITGEGKIDAQSAMGKTIDGVLAHARKFQRPVIAIGGAVYDEAENLYDKGLLSMFSICNQPMSLPNALQQSALLIEKATERVMRVLRGP
ncbi:glycerate kinase [candidate division KSB1 bacterium]|nr:glycerate kinase [candidate division KSB1 bacterium]RQW00839.1 MAG: glycerate kinase [candidate division KSB1 bacterium]